MYKYYVKVENRLKGNKDTGCSCNGCQFSQTSYVGFTSFVLLSGLTDFEEFLYLWGCLDDQMMENEKN